MRVSAAERLALAGAAEKTAAQINAIPASLRIVSFLK
jgi:hypothetical protein